MKPPILKKRKETKKIHNTTIVDNYSWVHQKNILEVLSNPSKLDKEVKSYLNEENKYTDLFFLDTKKLQKKLFKEIKSRIKLADKSVPFKDKRYIYWTKTTAKGNYSIHLRKKIKSGKQEIIWHGDKEKSKYKSPYFGLGDLSVSFDDKILGYSLDLKGSEYYTIYLRDLETNKNISKPIDNTNGNIVFSYDNKFLFYTKLDKNHRSKEIYLHEIRGRSKKDKLIYKEKIDRFSLKISTTTDKNFYVITSGDHSTNKCYTLPAKLSSFKPKLFKDYRENISYSLDSWNRCFYLHTNENAENFKLIKTEHSKKNIFYEVISPKKNTIIGSPLILKKWLLWVEKENANFKIYVRNIKNKQTKELLLYKNEVKQVSCSYFEKDLNSNFVYISYSSPKSPYKTLLYNLDTNKYKVVKKQVIPSGYNEKNYIVERVYAPSHDNKKIPITIIRHKKTKLDGRSKVLLYGYGSYGSSIGNGFSANKLSLINRGIIWANAHIRGGMECGMNWWKEGKMLKKKNTFLDYISCANYLIQNKYTKPKQIIGMGGSAGGLLMGAVLNQAPELFLAALLAVPFVDSLTTNLDHSLPLTVGEFKEFGNAKKYKKHFEYIKSYAPYNNIKKQNYPHIYVTTSLFDNRVLYDEPTKYVAKLRQHKKDNNILLLKTEMNAGHGGKTGRDASIEELAQEFSFILKVSRINT
ncbi:S9 family peptidase [Alphaproteobacteria bacterium]|nr:S9 family peptidase [Alphaproteobacteria bacterium]